jgi:hypothetical protein
MLAHVHAKDLHDKIFQRLILEGVGAGIDILRCSCEYYPAERQHAKKFTP